MKRLCLAQLKSSRTPMFAFRHRPGDAEPRAILANDDTRFRLVGREIGADIAARLSGGRRGDEEQREEAGQQSRHD